MSLAEDVAVTDGQEFVSEEEQNPEVNMSSDETRIYDPEYDFDANLITLPGKSEEDRWEISAGGCGTTGYGYVYGCGTGHA